MGIMATTVRDTGRQLLRHIWQRRCRRRSNRPGLPAVPKLTEVIQTDASFAVFFAQAVASTARRTELSFAAAVEVTDGSSGQQKV